MAERAGTGRRRAALWTAAAALLVAGPARAGAWIREPGHFFLKLGSSHNALYDPEHKPLGLEQSAMTFALSGEVGLPARLNLAFDLPYVVATNSFLGEGRYRNHSLGDARVQLERGLFSSLLLTLALEAKIPMYQTLSARETTGLVQVGDRFYAAAMFPEVGNGAFELSPKLLYGASFQPRPAWFTAELAANFRFDGLSHGLWAAVGAGAWVWPYHVAVALYARVNVFFPAPPDAKRPKGQDAEAALYTSGTLILSGSPWLPWLKLFASVGGIPVASKARGAFDVGFGIAAEY